MYVLSKKLGVVNRGLCMCRVKSYIGMCMKVCIYITLWYMHVTWSVLNRPMYVHVPQLMAKSLISNRPLNRPDIWLYIYEHSTCRYVQYVEYLQRTACTWTPFQRPRFFSLVKFCSESTSLVTRQLTYNFRTKRHRFNSQVPQMACSFFCSKHDNVILQLLN